MRVISHHFLRLQLASLSSFLIGLLFRLNYYEIFNTDPEEEIMNLLTDNLNVYAFKSSSFIIGLCTFFTQCQTVILRLVSTLASLLLPEIFCV